MSGGGELRVQKSMCHLQRTQSRQTDRETNVLTCKLGVGQHNYSWACLLTGILPSRLIHFDFVFQILIGPSRKLACRNSHLLSIWYAVFHHCISNLGDCWLDRHMFVLKPGWIYQVWWRWMAICCPGVSVRFGGKMGDSCKAYAIAAERLHCSCQS